MPQPENEVTHSAFLCSPMESKGQDSSIVNPIRANVEVTVSSEPSLQVKKRISEKISRSVVVVAGLALDTR